MFDQNIYLIINKQENNGNDEAKVNYVQSLMPKQIRKRRKVQSED